MGFDIVHPFRCSWYNDLVLPQEAPFSDIAPSLDC